MEIKTNFVVLCGKFVIKNLDNNKKKIKKIFNDLAINGVEIILLVDNAQSFNARAHAEGLIYNPDNLIIMPSFPVMNKNTHNMLSVALKLIPGNIGHSINYSDITFISTNRKDCVYATEVGVRCLIMDSKLNIIKHK